MKNMKKPRLYNKPASDKTRPSSKEIPIASLANLLPKSLVFGWGQKHDLHHLSYHHFILCSHCILYCCHSPSFHFFHCHCDGHHAQKVAPALGSCYRSIPFWTPKGKPWMLPLETLNQSGHWNSHKEDLVLMHASTKTSSDSQNHQLFFFWRILSWDCWFCHWN